MVTDPAVVVVAAVEVVVSEPDVVVISTAVVGVSDPDVLSSDPHAAPTRPRATTSAAVWV
jgi:hypothetical protein